MKLILAKNDSTIDLSTPTAVDNTQQTTGQEKSPRKSPQNFYAFSTTQKRTGFVPDSHDHDEFPSLKINLKKCRNFFNHQISFSNIVNSSPGSRNFNNQDIVN